MGIYFTDLFYASILSYVSSPYLESSSSERRSLLSKIEKGLRLSMNCRFIKKKIEIFMIKRIFLRLILWWKINFAPDICYFFNLTNFFSNLKEIERKERRKSKSYSSIKQVSEEKIEREKSVKVRILAIYLDSEKFSRVIRLMERTLKFVDVSCYVGLPVDGCSCRSLIYETMEKLWN